MKGLTPSRRAVVHVFCPMRSETTVRLKVTGAIDQEACEGLCESILAALARDDSLFLDLREASFVDPRTASAFFDLLRDAAAAGKTVVVNDRRRLGPVRGARDPDAGLPPA